MPDHISYADYATELAAVHHLFDRIILAEDLRNVASMQKLLGGLKIEKWEPVVSIRRDATDLTVFHTRESERTIFVNTDLEKWRQVVRNGDGDGEVIAVWTQIHAGGRTRFVALTFTRRLYNFLGDDEETRTRLNRSEYYPKD